MRIPRDQAAEAARSLPPDYPARRRAPAELRSDNSGTPLAQVIAAAARQQ